MDSLQSPNADTPFTSAPRAQLISSWKRYVIKMIAKELSRFTASFDEVLQLAPRPDDTGMLLQELKVKGKRGMSSSFTGIPSHWTHQSDLRTAILLNGNLNHSLDVQALLMSLYGKVNRHSRVLVVAYSPYMRWIYQLATRMRLRKGELPSTFLTEVDARNIAKISGFELVRIRPCVFFPFEILGIGTLFNRMMAAVPFFRRMSYSSVLAFRPIRRAVPDPSLSIIIPARNEKGNIETAIKRIPQIAPEQEIIFVEGNSTDGTWEEIQRVIQDYSGPYKLKAFQQKGKGKNDAVRVGFANATYDVLTILDADLTMPPELLHRFYDAYRDGHGDFINGNRLSYPMEGEAMKFINHLGNVFFAKALSWVLDSSLGDSLCGTKLLARKDYIRIVAWRERFGDFDPFGDFELLYPAAELGYGIVDVPVAYKARVYGTTNIRRFRDGFKLLKMTAIGFLKIRMG